MDTIDWKLELKRISRQFDGLPPDPLPELATATGPARARAAAARPRSRPAAPPHAPLRQAPRRAPFDRPRVTLDHDARLAIASGARIALTAALAVSLHWWPYATTCGAGLAGYVAATCMVAVGGVAAGRFTWRHQLGAAHLIALALVAAGLALVAVQVLPRMGLATFPGVHGAWACR